MINEANLFAAQRKALKKLVDTGCETELLSSISYSHKQEEILKEPQRDGSFLMWEAGQKKRTAILCDIYKSFCRWACLSIASCITASCFSAEIKLYTTRHPA